MALGLYVGLRNISVCKLLAEALLQGDKLFGQFRRLPKLPLTLQLT
jgi:hypothetical protein